MSLGDSLKKEQLKKTYNKYRNQADQAKENGDYRDAARYYGRCGDILEQLVEIESSDRVSEKWQELAENMREGAETLEKRARRGHQMSGSEESGQRTREERPASDDDEIDPSQFLVESPDIDFEDVGGMAALKRTLRESVIDPLNRPEKYERYGLGVVNGVLLYGPPGTGKTYITRALAGKLDYNYIELEASDLTSSLVGEAANNVSEVFEVAKQCQPCLVFLDEIDSIAAERSGGNQKTMSESQMITQFLTEMSSLGDSDVVFIAATNLPGEIDGAAWRRFDKRIEVPPPDGEGREAVLRIHLADRPVDGESLDWATLRDVTDGYTPSDIELIVDEAARKALVESDETGEFVHIGQRHLTAAIDEIDPSLAAWDGYDMDGSPR